MSEHKYSSDLESELINKFPIGIYEIDFKTLKFKHPNDIILQYTGYTKEEFENMTPQDLLTTESFAHFLDRMQRRQRGEKISSTTQFEIKRKDGGTYWVLVASTWTLKDDIPESVVAFAINITDQKKVEEQLLEEKNKAQMYLDMAFNIFVGLDTEGRIELVNRTGCDILGIDECFLVGQNWIENYVAIEDRIQTKILFNDILNGDYDDNIVEYTNYIIDTKKEKHLIKWKIKVVKYNGNEIKGMFLSGDDITQQHMLEHELLRLFESKENEITNELKSRKNKYIKKVESPSLDRAVYLVANGFHQKVL